ncbi:MAG: hypothetical protein HY260_06660 [Chloroflexi bacterium]|nr:hypothetical protein [Chloroflexota bacterium]
MFSLEFALKTMREDVLLAKTIATYSGAPASRNPVLAFAFSNAPSAVIDGTILNIAESMRLLEDAFVERFGESLFQGRGRHRRPKDRYLAAIVDLRDRAIAHRIEAGAHDPWALLRSHGHRDPFVLLEASIRRVEKLVKRLRADGYFGGITMSTERRIPTPFTTADLRRVVAAANGVSPRGGRPAR